MESNINKYIHLRYIYNDLSEIIYNADDLDNTDEFSSDIKMFHVYFQKYKKLLHEVNIKDMDVSPQTMSKIEKEYKKMLDDESYFEWQDKYWQYGDRLLSKTDWVYKCINKINKRALNKAGEYEVDIPKQKIVDFLKTLINIENLEIYESEIERIIKGTITDIALYRLYDSLKYTKTNTFNFTRPSHIIKETVPIANFINNNDDTISTIDEFKYSILPSFKNNWQLIYIKKVPNVLRKINDSVKEILTYLFSDEKNTNIKNNTIFVFYNDEYKTLAFVCKYKSKYYIRFIPVGKFNKNTNYFDKLNKINESFSNPFSDIENENISDITITEKKHDDLIKGVELWDKRKRLNQVAYQNNKMLAINKLFKGDIVESAPVIILNQNDLYSKNVRDIVFDISPGKFGVPLGYAALYRTTLDVNKEPNIDYEYNIENNELNFIALKNIDKGEELIIKADNDDYSNQLKEDYFSDIITPSAYPESFNDEVINIKPLTDQTSQSNSAYSGFAPITGGL